MYSPAGDATFDAVMSKFVKLNNKRLGRPDSLKLESSTAWSPQLDSLPKQNLGVVGVASEDFIYSFAERNPNVTAWAVSFSTFQSTKALNNGAQSQTVNEIQYQLWYNASLTTRLFRIKGAPPFVASGVEPFNDEVAAMVRALDEAIIDHVGGQAGDNLHLDISTQDYPDFGNSQFRSCPANADTSFRSLGGIFLFIPMQVIFFAALNTIVNEKEQNLKFAMKTIGLRDSLFWLSHYVSISLVVILNALVTVLFGRAMGFNLFLNADVSLMFIFFSLFGLASLSFAMFLCSLSAKVRTAVGGGFFLTIVGTIYIGLGGIATYAWYTDPNDPTALNLNPVWQVCMFFPFFNYNKLLRDIMAYTLLRNVQSGTKCSVQPGVYYGWSDVSTPNGLASSSLGSINKDLVPLPVESFYLLLMNIVLWYLLALYVDQVFPNENGQGEHPLFFLQPSYYGFKPSTSSSSNKSSDKRTKAFGNLPDASRPLADEDPDVTAERKYTEETSKDELGLRMYGLHKRYYAGLKAFLSWISRALGQSDLYLESWGEAAGTSRIAVHELSLSVEKGQMLALLGSNGAGKTSTMKIMYGASPITSGDAHIFGMDVSTEMNEIRKQLGVCPQFDVLFPDLTSAEHIELFSGIKGIPKAEMEKIKESRLKQMKLWNVRNQRTSQYSGGMKRRLSVVLSTLGDPKCVFLDEPNTGVDPFNRRIVWSFLEEFKKGRIIILTTHSMEEADTLADKIAIMVDGRLRAVGKSIRLKNKFGSGYRVHLVVPKAADVEFVKNEIAKTTHEVQLVEEEYIGTSGKNASDAPITPASPLIAQRKSLNDIENPPALPSENAEGKSARLVYEVQSIGALKSLIKYLEKSTETKPAGEGKKRTNAIASFGLSQATLEDVFLKTAANRKKTQ